ncbi:hypothetical protein [Comamonas sp. JNW]|uniref:hypothetical protein n=1 Tax=Comamonas sp. JNW TaxID=2170731 RepID=UPI001402054E|nr:hypothetical protein [Comamonas sp. JNW]
MYFKIPGPLGVREHSNNHDGSFSNKFFHNGVHQSPSQGSDGAVADLYFPTPLAHKIANSDISAGLMCEQLSEAEFSVLVMALCQDAIALAEQRQAELQHWDAAAKKRTWIWFNSSSDELRDFLLKGIAATIVSLRALRAKDFVQYSEENINLGSCRGSVVDPEAAASVCPVDITNKRIMIAPKFCGLSRDKRNPYNGEIGDGDSQLLTLVHEVTHFKDVFGSNDNFYSTFRSIKYVEDPGIRFNADSLAAYIIGTNPRKERY